MSVVAIFRGGHGDGMRLPLDLSQLDTDGLPPPTIEASCPDCGQRTFYELTKMKRANQKTRAWYRAKRAT